MSEKSPLEAVCAVCLCPFGGTLTKQMVINKNLLDVLDFKSEHFCKAP